MVNLRTVLEKKQIEREEQFLECDKRIEQNVECNAITGEIEETVVHVRRGKVLLIFTKTVGDG